MRWGEAQVTDAIERSQLGLWWRTFTDDDRFSPFPRNTAALTLLALVPLVALVFAAPAGVAVFYVPSVLCVMAHLFMIYLCGTFGRVVTGPVLVFGALNVGWIWGLVGTLSHIPGFALVIAVYMAVVLSLCLKRLWVQGRADEIALTLMSAICLLAGKYYADQVRQGQIGIGILHIADAVDIATIRAVFDGTFLAVTLVSAAFLALYVHRLWGSAPGSQFVSRKLAFEAAAVVAGLLPLALVRACEGRSEAVAAACVLMCYAAFAYLCGLCDVRVEAWTLVASLVCATLSMARATDVAAAPPVAAFGHLVEACRTSAPLSETLDAAQAIVGMCSHATQGSVLLLRNLVGAAARDAMLPQGLVDAFSFYLGLVVMASVMGVASFLGQRLRERRRIEARLSSNAR